MTSRVVGKSGRTWGDALLGRPWLLVAAVASFVALPVLVLGQASENDTRARLQAAQTESAANAADGATSTTLERYESIRKSLEALALKPRPEDSLIASAVQRADMPTLQALADTVQRLFVRDIRHVYIAVRGPAATITDATILVESPARAGLVGRNLGDLPGNMAARVQDDVGTDVALRTGTFPHAFSGTATAHLSRAYSGTADAPSGDVVIATIWNQRGSFAPLATIIAEVDTSRMFADAAAASLGSADDAYFVEKGADGRWWMIGRARGPTPFPLRDLSGDPIAQLLEVGLIARTVARDGTPDPLGGGTRMVAATRMSSGSAWVVVLRDTSAVDREIDAVLGQLAAARFALVALLLLGALVVARAASAQLRQRRALALANERVEAASLHKSAFLSSMSHELRTPLNSINGFSDVLLSGISGALSEKQREYLTDIRGSGEQLLALVNDILDLSKVEAGKMELHPTEFDIGATVEGVHRVMAPIADQKGQRLRLDATDAATVRLDEARLRQVLLNVLSNAVKYTPDGGTVTTSILRRDGMVQIAVRDSGVGIAPEDHGRVFEDFTRVDSGYARTQQGTGLGLALARRLVRLMGGDIGLASTPGEGSTFTITVPAVEGQTS